MTAAEVAFGTGAVEDEDWERERKTLPASRALAAFDAGKPVALTGAYEFDLTIPGGELPCAGVTWVGVMPTHRRRGILRDLMRRAARGRARVGRADRGALGLRGGDLRSLRLRAGCPEWTREVGPRALLAARGGGRARSGSSTPTRRSSSSRRSTSACARRGPGMLSRDRALVERASARRPRKLAARREPEVLRRSRARRCGRGVCVLPGQGRVGGRLSEGRSARDRGARDVGRRRRGRSGASCTGSTSIVRVDGLDLRSRLDAAPCSFATRARSACASATGSGCGSSTSTRRSAPARTSPASRSCSR